MTILRFVTLLTILFFLGCDRPSSNKIGVISSVRIQDRWTDGGSVTLVIQDDQFCYPVCLFAAKGNSPIAIIGKVYPEQGDIDRAVLPDEIAKCCILMSRLIVWMGIQKGVDIGEMQRLYLECYVTKNVDKKSRTEEKVSSFEGAQEVAFEIVRFMNANPKNLLMLAKETK